MLCPHLGAGSAAETALAIPVCPRGAVDPAAPELECHLWGWQGAGHSGAAAEHTVLVKGSSLRGKFLGKHCRAAALGDVKVSRELLLWKPRMV